MPSSADRRKRAANRARTSLPTRRSPTASQRLTRRGLIILGIVIAAALVASLVGTITISTNGTVAPTTPSRTDPSQLIARATANPNDANVVRDLADYYDQTGQYQQALIAYQRYLQLRPDDAQAHTSVGTLLLVSGDVPGAQSQFVQAIGLKPTPRTEAEAHLGLGNVYTSLQPPRLSDALNEYRKASDLDPSGDVGNSARTRLAGLQQQLSIGTVTVIAPTTGTGSGSVAPPVRPTGAP